MTPKPDHKQIGEENQETLRDLLQEKMKLAIRYTLIQALEEEVEAYIQAGPYERTENRQDIAMGATCEDWGLPWVNWKPCQCRAPARAFGASCLNAIEGDKQSWTKASAKCSCRE